MEQNKTSSKKLIVILACVLVVLVAAASIGYTVWKNNLTPDPSGSSNLSTSSAVSGETKGEKHITVEVVVGENITKFELDTDAEFLRGALEEENLIKGSESDYGLFVTEVNGVAADDSLRQWWCFTKGGETLMTGVDSTPVADGDTFEITLSTY